MARTDAGALLTAQHHRAQLALRAAALRDYLTVWPLWNGDDATFEQLVAATVPVVRAHHQLSASVAVAYYQSLRAAERPGGTPAPRLASLDTNRLTLALYVTGRNMARRARDAGQTQEGARQAALVRTAGAVSRMVLAGGRDSLVASVQADPRADGYRRVVSPRACDYCRELADEGITDGDFHAHDHCGCGAEPAWR